jgi:hypothetical protein
VIEAPSGIEGAAFHGPDVFRYEPDAALRMLWSALAQKHAVQLRRNRRRHRLGVGIGVVVLVAVALLLLLGFGVMVFTPLP